MTKANKKEQISVWRPNDVPGIELRTGTAVKEPYPRHWHEEYQFCFIQDGGGELFYRGAHYDTPRSSLFIVHPGEVHSNQTETGCSFRSMYVDSELISETIAGATGRALTLPFFATPLVLDREITTRYNTLHFSLEHSATTLERQSLLLDLLTQLLARHAQDPFQAPSPKKARRAVVEVRDYIIEFHSRNISLQELARLANLSPFYLTRVFASTVGMPPHAFQTQVRVAQAKKLIKTGLPLADVAALTGFADQSHFIRHFKHLMKITPSDYLNN